jgi:hypothetical protein
MQPKAEDNPFSILSKIDFTTEYDEFLCVTLKESIWDNWKGGAASSYPTC